MRFVIISVLFFVALQSQAQKSSLIFFNDSAKSAYQSPVGGLVVLEYQGYLKQLEVESNYILNVNDSIVTLGKPRMFLSPVQQKQIRVEDITGFRKISVGSVFLKSMVTVGATLGSYYLLKENSDNLTNTEYFIYSAGVGIITRLSIKLIFPDNKVKHKIKNGWKVMVR